MNEELKNKTIQAANQISNKITGLVDTLSATTRDFLAQQVMPVVENYYKDLSVQIVDDVCQQELTLVGYRFRFNNPDGPTPWVLCDEQAISRMKNSPNIEIDPVFSKEKQKVTEPVKPTRKVGSTRIFSINATILPFELCRISAAESFHFSFTNLDSWEVVSQKLKKHITSHCTKIKNPKILLPVFECFFVINDDTKVLSTPEFFAYVMQQYDEHVGNKNEKKDQL